MTNIPNMSAEAWEARYQNADTPWDLGAPTPQLLQLSKMGLFPAGSQVLVPGGGRSYDAIALAQAGCQTTVVDFALCAGDFFLTEAARLGLQSNCHFYARDFFSLSRDGYHQSRYDYIWEYTFYCAIDPSLRENYFSQMAALLAPQGKLIGLFFPTDNRAGGPPFAITLEEIKDLASKYFTIEFQTPELSVTPRAGKESLGILTRL